MSRSEASRPRGALVAVAVAFGAQGLGYAAVATSLPAVKDRIGLSDGQVAALLLGMCVAAALGSLLANAVAVRSDSRRALCLGFGLQAAGLVVVGTTHEPILFLAFLGLYGIGLGAVDAGNNMQGVALQADGRTPVLGRLYCVFTAGGIIGALLSAGSGLLQVSALSLVAACSLLQLLVAYVGSRAFLVRPVDERATRSGRDADRLPRAAIWLVGSVLLAAYVLDSAVSTWSTVHLADGLSASAAIAPMGYAAYQVVVLLTRLTTDASTARWGVHTVGATAAVMGGVGTVLVVVGPSLWWAVSGFALAGLAVGSLVPLAFTAAGALLPSRSDEVVARINLFNYGGAVVGAVLPGVVAVVAPLRLGFLVPALVVLAVLPVLGRLQSPAHLTGSR